MADVKKIIAGSLGWQPEITGESVPEPGFTRFTFRNPEDAEKFGEIILMDGEDVAVIRENNGEAAVLSPLEGPATFDLTLTARIMDKRTWKEIFSEGPQEATERLFGDIPGEDEGITWGTVTVKKSGDHVRMTLPVTVTDRVRAAAHVREIREAMWSDSWIPENLRDLAFEAAVGSSDAPSPDDNGYELVHEKAWPGKDPHEAVMNAANDEVGKVSGKPVPGTAVSEITESGAARAYAEGWKTSDPTSPWWRAHMIIAHPDGAVKTYPIGKMEEMCQDIEPEETPEP